MTKKDKAIYEYGAAQINRLRDVLLSAGAVTAKEFENILSLVKEEQAADVIERGTLALEKEKANRPVDKFHYAKYRRASVDILGATLSYGLFMRLFNTVTTERYGETSEEQKDKLNLIVHEVTGLVFSREKDYQKEMKSDPEKILADLCGFIDNMTVDNFYWITIEKDTDNTYTGAYIDIFDVTREGLTALQKSKGGTEENAQTLHEHIKQAAIRLTGQEPPENDPPHITFRRGFPSTKEECVAVEGGSSDTPSESLEEDKALYQIDGQQTFEELDRAEIADKTAEILSIAGKRVINVPFPLDKLNNNVWILPEKEKDRRRVTLHVESKDDKKNKREVTISCELNFGDLDISTSKKLTSYDKRVCIAVGALLDAGNEVMTPRQIYKAMGNNGAAGKTDIERIEKSLEKMRVTIININNEDEARKHKSRTAYIYSGAVLPYKSIETRVNGRVVDAAIKPLDAPPLLLFAKEREQLTTLPVKMLCSPLSKTEQNISLEDYIIDRIAKAGKGTGHPKILYKTVYEHLKITNNSRTQKQRVREKMFKLLDYYKSIERIKYYTSLKDGVVVKPVKEEK